MGDLLSAVGSPQLWTWLALAAVPLVLVSATSFVKISIVFAALRNALGTPDLPSGLIVAALAFVLSVFVMAPVADRLERVLIPIAATDAASPDGPSTKRLLKAGAPVVASFFRANSDEAERQMFAELAEKRGLPAAASDLRVLWPSFLLTELKEAFQMGFLVLVPFLILDLVVANIMLAVGLTSLPPSAIALPLKLLLFLSVDGFSVLSRALVGGYA